METLKRISKDFCLEELSNEDYEKTALNKINRSMKMDEIDTVTFGLETDDNKIIKVYVQSDQSDEFEKALSTKLGEVDDIEEVLNLLSKDFNIVDVEYPDEESEESEGEQESDSVDKEDGSDILDDRVFSDKNKRREGMSENKHDLSNTLLENTTSIENRFTTAAQLMVYHAIIDLGIPEIALARNPYRASIIKGIKQTAEQVNANSILKTALKNFIKRSDDFEKKAEENKESDGNLDRPAIKTESVQRISIKESEESWEFNYQDEVLEISNGDFVATIEGEEVEKMLKGISNKEITICKTEDGAKVVFSPRGSQILVKNVGQKEGIMMTSKEVDRLLSTISK